jgi:hypothetical protein
LVRRRRAIADGHSGRICTDSGDVDDANADDANADDANSNAADADAARQSV